MEGKKISFGFVRRAAARGAPQEEPEARQYIECVEERAIKVVGGEAVEEKKPLVIPMRPNTLMTAERLQQIAQEVESSLEEPETKEQPEDKKNEPLPGETLEQQAARELIEDAKNIKKVETQVLTVPLAAQPALMGEKESTLEDYETVPVNDFGMAMLRGMGWSQGKESKYVQPTLRPKGLGLGADKLIKQSDKKKGGKDEQTDLALNKGTFVRIIAGKHSGCYGKVVSMDEESGRVLVEMAVKRESLSLSEMMLQPVTRQEYDKQSRVINSEKYEEYIRKEKSAQSSEQSTSRHSEKSRDKPNGRSQDRSHSRSYKTNPGRYSLSDEEQNRKELKDNRSKRNSPERDSQRKSYKRDDSSDYEGRSRKDKIYQGDQPSSDEERIKRDFNEKRKQRKRDTPNEDLRNNKIEQKVRDSSNSDEGTDKKYSSSRLERRRISNSDDDRHRRKHSTKTEHKSRNYSSDSIESRSSLSDSPKRSTKKKKERDEKRDIDKKRKGKKKKRDRDRSPNYRKHKR